MFEKIEARDIGEAWVKLIDLVLKKGSLVTDGAVKLKELMNVSVIITDPGDDDHTLQIHGDKNMIQWMKRNFLSHDEIDGWGYSYGQRLKGYKGFDQLSYVINKLKNNIESKSATISLCDPPNDLKHVPCINVLDFKVRQGICYLNAFFRSQDICKKMYADALCLNDIANTVCNALGVSDRKIILHIISAHIYQQDYERCYEILRTTSET